MLSFIFVPFIKLICIKPGNTNSLITSLYTLYNMLVRVMSRDMALTPF